MPALTNEPLRFSDDLHRTMVRDVLAVELMHDTHFRGIAVNVRQALRVAEDAMRTTVGSHMASVRHFAVVLVEYMIEAGWSPDYGRELRLKSARGYALLDHQSQELARLILMVENIRDGRDRGVHPSVRDQSLDIALLDPRTSRETRQAQSIAHRAASLASRYHRTGGRTMPESRPTHVSYAQTSDEIRQAHMALMNDTIANRVMHGDGTPEQRGIASTRRPEIHARPYRPVPGGIPYGMEEGDIFLDTTTGDTYTLRDGLFDPGPNIGGPRGVTGVTTEGTITGRLADVVVHDEVHEAGPFPYTTPGIASSFENYYIPLPPRLFRNVPASEARAELERLAGLAGDHPRQAVATPAQPSAYHVILTTQEQQANELIAVIGDLDRDDAIRMVLSFLSVDKARELVEAVKRVKRR